MYACDKDVATMRGWTKQKGLRWRGHLDVFIVHPLGTYGNPLPDTLTHVSNTSTYLRTRSSDGYSC